MTKEPLRVTFDEFALRLRGMFDAVADQRRPVLVEREGTLYRVELEAAERKEIWTAYDIKKARQAIADSAGALAGVDGVALLTDIHEQRQQIDRKP